MRVWGDGGGVCVVVSAVEMESARAGRMKQAHGGRRRGERRKGRGRTRRDEQNGEGIHKVKHIAHTKTLQQPIMFGYRRNCNLDLDLGRGARFPQGCEHVGRMRWDMTRCTFDLDLETAL